MGVSAPIPTKTGLRISADGLILDAENPHRDRGAIRVVLTVRQGGLIVYRDTVNLTSGRARERIVRTLAEKGIPLDPQVLVILDEVCRTKPPSSETHLGDGGTDVSETPPLDITGLEAGFKHWLLIKDLAYLPVLTGAVLAHPLGGDPVWLLAVGPPGGTKTEPLRALYGYPGIYPLSDLTAQTFASGLDLPHGRDASLLTRLNDEILVLKDFTTVLQMHREERQKILAQLREIYDGRFDKVWGTGRELHWEGRLGFVGGVTPIIDKHHAAMAVLGERFVLFRPLMPDRNDLARAALGSCGHEVEMRSDLRQAMHGFLRSRSTEPPTLSEAGHARLAAVADFTTRARSAVVREGYSRELQYAPEPEAPTRFAKVLCALAGGIARAYDSPKITDRELHLVGRVALDCLPLVRRRVIAVLVEQTIHSGDALVLYEVVKAAGGATGVVRRTLEDLEALGVVRRFPSGTGKADGWAIKPECADAFRVLTDSANGCATLSDKSGKVSGDGVPETSEGTPHTELGTGSVK